MTSQRSLSVGLLILSLGQIRPATAQDFSTAKRMFLENRLDSALVAFRRLASTAPANPEVLAWTAETERRLGQFEAAERSARRALSQAPCQAMAHNVLGDA